MTLSYVIHYPNEVAGVVTLAGAMYKEGYTADNGDLLSKMITIPILGGIMLHTLLKTPLAKGMASSMVKATFAPEDVPAGYEKELFAIGFQLNHFRANREDVLAFPGTSRKLSVRYKEITVLVVIYIRKKDIFNRIKQGERLKRDIPHAVFRVMSEIGHRIPEFYPKIVIESIEEITKDTTSVIYYRHYNEIHRKGEVLYEIQ